MISFQEYFEKRVEELIGNSGNQTFFVFRGFEIEQIKYLVSHPNTLRSQLSNCLCCMHFMMLQKNNNKILLIQE